MAIVWVGPIVIALVAWLIDLVFMVKDITGDAKKILSNSMSTLIPLLIFAFASFNLGFVTSLAFMKNFAWLNDIVLRVALALILAVVIHAKSAVFRAGPGSHEKWLHTLIVAAIVLAGPYAWMYIEPMLPF